MSVRGRWRVIETPGYDMTVPGAYILFDQDGGEFAFDCLTGSIHGACDDDAVDSTERVYIGFTSKRSDVRQDFAVFRCEPPTGERRFLGTFIDVSQAAWNLRPSEEIPKGHTRMLEIDRKIYMGSQGFHDLKAAIDTLHARRHTRDSRGNIYFARFDGESREGKARLAILHHRRPFLKPNDTARSATGPLGPPYPRPAALSGWD